MKLQVSFDMTDLTEALELAHTLHDFVDIFEIGNLLIKHYGIEAIKEFRKTFPNATLLADSKIIDNGQEAAKMFFSAGADWISVLAGASRTTVHATCSLAHSNKKLVMLDLIDSSSLGQSALDAKNLGIDALLLHRPAEEELSALFLDRWDMVKSNTTLPLFIDCYPSDENIYEIIKLNPAGIVVGSTITQAGNPSAIARMLANALRSS